MNRRGYRSSIPAKAKPVVHKWHKNGADEAAYYVIEDVKVGYRCWYENGEIDIEYGIKDEQKHGVEYHFAEDGQLTFMEPFRNGRANGTARQSSHDGRLLITYTLRDGVGLDLWCHENGSLAEEHLYPAENQLGYSRRWNDDNRTIWWEYFYLGGRGYHGITREWNRSGRLKRGFPQYFIQDRKVTKRQYLQACKMDPSLPPFRPEDNEPYRSLPAEYVAQRTQRQDAVS